MFGDKFFLTIACALICSLNTATAVETTGSNSNPVGAEFLTIEQVEKQGVVVELAVENISSLQPLKDNLSNPSDASKVISGDNARIRFFAHDTTSKTGLSGAYPAGWIHPRPKDDNNDEASCQRKVQNFVGGSLFSRAHLDLNTYYVMTLNDDATLSVVDPLFGFGGSKLLTMLSLPAVGFDWVKTASQSHVFVSIPATNEIIKLDTATWQMQHLSGNLATDTEKYSSPVSLTNWQQPKRLVLQNDQSYLWATVKEGVAIFNSEPFELKTMINTGKDASEIVFSADGQFGFVLNAGSQTVSVIDTLNFNLIKTIKTMPTPVAMTYSALAETLYVSHQESGVVLVIDAKSHQAISRIQSQPGLGQILASPDGRLIFMVNPVNDRLSIIDTASNRIIQSGIVESQPVEIAFSDELAYISHANSSTLLMVPLDDKNVGREGATIPTVDTPGGDSAPGLKMSTAASGIVQAPGGSSVLIANYVDQAVYFFKEGMAAPMGQFNNYGRSPRAVMAIDRSLREMQQSGVYETVVKLPDAGLYDVVYFMDNPRIVHCFTLTVEANSSTPNQAKQTSITQLRPSAELNVGEKIELHFNYSSEPLNVPLTPINALVSLSSGQWRDQQELKTDSQGNVSFIFSPPVAGYYQLILSDNNGLKQKFIYQAL